MDTADVAILGGGKLTPKQYAELKPTIVKRAMGKHAEDNLSKFGNLIAIAEGTVKADKPNQDPYRVGFGFSQIDDLSKHPSAKVKFNEGGKTLTTTAAGKYQITETSWKDYINRAKKGQQVPFTPENQEDFYRWKLKDRGAYDDVVNGRFQDAINKLGDEWVSLPSSKRDQPKRDWKFIQSNLQDLGADPNKYLTAQGASTPSFESYSTALDPTYKERANAVSMAAAEQQQQQQLAAQEAAKQEELQRKQEENQVIIEANKKAEQLKSNLLAAIGQTDVFKIESDLDGLPSSLDEHLKKLVTKYV